MNNEFKVTSNHHVSVDLKNQLSPVNLFKITERAQAANDTTRAQINNIPEKSHVIIIIINKQGQMISRMRGLIIQAK